MKIEKICLNLLKVKTTIWINPHRHNYNVVTIFLG